MISRYTYTAGALLLMVFIVSCVASITTYHNPDVPKERLRNLNDILLVQDNVDMDVQIIIKKHLRKNQMNVHAPLKEASTYNIQKIVKELEERQLEAAFYFQYQGGPNELDRSLKVVLPDGTVGYQASWNINASTKRVLRRFFTL